MSTNYIPFVDKPGVFADDTALAASVHYIDSDKIEWENARWQIRKAFEAATTDEFEGVCRGLFVWRNLTAQPIAAIGTHLRCYALFDGDLYDITPVVTFGVATNPFAVLNGSATVKFCLASHGLIDDQRIRFPGETAVNGATISATDGYEVTVDGTNTVSFTSSTAATLDGAGVGGTIDYDFLLPPGLEDGLGGAGYGVGGFGLGGFGEGADINELYPRSWCFGNWGQNLIANPRGLGLYEWAPAYAAPELVTNGTFAAGTDWTLGTGWSISGGQALATTNLSTKLEQQLELESAAHFLLEADVTRTGGTVSPQIGSTAIGAAVSVTSRIRRSFFTDPGTLNFLKDTSFVGAIDNVEVHQQLELVAIPNAPTQNTCMLVTAEDMIMVGGTIDIDTGEFDPLLVRWCARRDNQNWTPGFEEGNTAGFKRLAGASRIVRLVQMTGEILVLTDDTPFVARFDPDPTVTYRFTPLVPGFPLVGPNAVAVAGGAAYWVKNTNLEIARYAGGQPEVVPCSVRQTAAANLAPSQHDKMYAAPVGERQWQLLYPDSRDGNECSRYIKFNFIEGCWDQGTYARSAWTNEPGFGFPLAANLDGQVYYQEKGDSADGGAYSWMIESGAFQLRGGKRAAVMGIIPDFKNFVGGATLTVKAYGSPAGAVQEFGPYQITADTEVVDVRADGKLLSFRLEGSAAPAGGRSGTLQIDVRNTRCGR